MPRFQGLLGSEKPKMYVREIGIRTDMAKEYYYKWVWDLESSPEALWPLVSDTNRFNRDTGLPPIELLGVTQGVRLVRFKLPLVQVEWEEEPFEWIYPYRFGILRRFRKGPLAEMRVECRLARLDPSGTRLVYEVWAKPKNFLGDIGIIVGIGMISAKRFGDTFRSYDRVAARGDPLLIVAKGRNLSPAGHNRFKALSERLREQGVHERILDRLYEYLQCADNISIQRMRPYALADGWLLPRRAVLEAFLRATRLGMLDLYWDLLCPECRGVAEEHARLGDLYNKAHCNTCQIDFNMNFDHNVEVVFRPNPSIRVVDAKLEFCVGSPQRQPHIIFSLVVPPREELPISITLEAGRYTLRVTDLPGAQIIKAEKDGLAKVAFRAAEIGRSNDMLKIGAAPYIRLINDTQQTRVFQLQRTAWSDQAATAADVTTLQVFRDLFSNEVLRPGEEISVGTTTLMFTDLRSSTKLYREIGDAPAFGRVRDYFDALERAISAEGGSVVKTMGDAVMAAFRKPVSALRAIWNAHRQIALLGNPPLSIKAGIHSGPCIVVNLNGRLDYFGSTVNVTARLPHFSNGGETILSETVRKDLEVAEFLEKNAPPNSLVRFQSEIRGYDRPMDLWRLRM